ncbi:ZIP family metal transporter [Notoacmeibacter ruber]|uniref:Zinc transporter n=1 Tax=Notoacmeibacter ruber TaxID=2670375 RepID=A0A3L7J8R4_9HYPH|nr:zinc transporter [Notoacmeibacter ruber]RLQ87127.1 zinc transporter [Notoacmeibacter ruber]
MLLTILTIVVVSVALIAGAVWGVYGRIGRGVEGFILAAAGGALMVSALLELVDPATKQAGVWPALGMMMTGAAVFTVLDYLVDHVWKSGAGAGLLVAITLDGIPENLALGVSLIGAGPLEVAALAGSIFLSNLPEAAGGAKRMADSMGKTGTILLWAATAAILSGAAIAGNFLLSDVGEGPLALIRSFAGGAVIASLATEIFPKAFREDHLLAGIATALGLAAAVWLRSLSGG